MSTEGYADIIRLALKARGLPMTLDEIIEDAVGDVDRKGLGTIMRQRVVAGEIISHTEEGITQYNLNPDHVPRSARGAGNRTKSQVKRSPLPSPPIAPRPFNPVPALAPALSTPAVDAGCSDSPAAPPVPLTPAASAMPASAAGTHTPFALRERLGAIAEDIEQALDDACKAELSHALIRHLVKANNAAQAATRELGR